MREKINMAEFYAGDVFNRDGLAYAASADSVLNAWNAKSVDGIMAYATAQDAKGYCDGIGTITANACTASSYEPIALKTDVSEIEDALKGLIARVAALEDSMPRKDNLRRQLKTLNYKREL
jgi:hypothetical protein